MDEKLKAGANNQPVKIVEIAGKPVEVDVEIADMVRVLNRNGFPTRASCSGHGHRPATIGLADGRWLVIAKDHDEFRKIEALFPTDINGKLRTPTTVTDEVTEAMIEAGLMATERGKFHLLRIDVERIYTAMRLAAPQGSEE